VEPTSATHLGRLIWPVHFAAFGWCLRAGRPRKSQLSCVLQSSRGSPRLSGSSLVLVLAAPEGCALSRDLRQREQTDRDGCGAVCLVFAHREPAALRRRDERVWLCGELRDLIASFELTQVASHTHWRGHESERLLLDPCSSRDRRLSLPLRHVQVSESESSRFSGSGSGLAMKAQDSLVRFKYGVGCREPCLPRPAATPRRARLPSSHPWCILQPNNCARNGQTGGPGRPLAHV